jgi:polyferredoxin
LSALARQAATFDVVSEPEGRGDCIDCHRCVSVCPTGVDIREGLQMGCIGCGLCIDACNDIMRRIDRPEGLIRFDTEESEPKHSLATPRLNLIRPKSLLYAVLCLIAMGGITYGVASMPEVMLDVDPQRNPPFIQLSDGSIRNDYSIRLAHRRQSLGAVKITSVGVPDARVRLRSEDSVAASNVTVDVPPTRQLSDKLFIVVPAGRVHPGRVAISIVFTDVATGEILGHVESYFWGPGR